MALKDWRQTSNTAYGITWKNDKTGQGVEIIESLVSSKRYYTNITYRGSIIKRKVSRSEYNALKYAQSYMRKH